MFCIFNITLNVQKKKKNILCPKNRGLIAPGILEMIGVPFCLLAAAAACVYNDRGGSGKFCNTNEPVVSRESERYRRIIIVAELFKTNRGFDAFRLRCFTRAYFSQSVFDRF